MKKITTVVLSGGELGVYVNSKGDKMRVGPKGPGVYAPDVYEALSKSDARVVRKALYAAGHYYLASAPRASHLARVAA